MSGKVFRVRPADGNGWRLDFRGNGYYFVNTDSGLNMKGTWRTEDGRLCTESPRAKACDEVRVVDEVIYLKRSSNGEVVALKEAR